MSELLSIVVPVFNEEATVRAVIERLLSIDLPVEREIVVVNDGSTDGTRRVLDALPPTGDTLRIVHAAVNGGKGRAIRTGFEHARGTIVAIQSSQPAEFSGSSVPGQGRMAAPHERGTPAWYAPFLTLIRRR